MRDHTHDKRRRMYRDLLALVTLRVNAWDPCLLIAGGAPKDEYSAEAARIASASLRFTSPSDFAVAVASIFNTGFGQDELTAESCQEFSSSLLTELRRQGFLEQQP